jgi:hypothetical protein
MSMTDTSSAISAITSVSGKSVSGAIEAVADAPATISSFFALGGKLIYGTGYTVAFAIVFPLALIFAAIPKRNADVRNMEARTFAAGSAAHHKVFQNPN